MSDLAPYTLVQPLEQYAQEVKTCAEARHPHVTWLVDAYPGSILITAALADKPDSTKQFSLNLRTLTASPENTAGVFDVLDLLEKRVATPS